MMVQCYVVYAFSRPISWELGGGGFGVTQGKLWLGCVALFPKTLILLKICDFPNPIWPDQKFEILFMAIAAGTVALNTIFEGSLIDDGKNNFF